jgi:GT2 family glycosyltransferase
MEQPDISVVIVSYNVKDLLLKCLDSLHRWAPPTMAVETIVVDNNSSDGSAAAVTRRFPQVSVIENKFNAGFPAANNQAFRTANGRYIFMLNPDTEFIEDTLGKLFTRLEKDQRVSLIAPMLLNTDRSRQLSVWRFPTVWTVFCETHHLTRLLGRKHYADKSYHAPFDAQSCSGAALFFRREVLGKIGLLDEAMFWIEDVDFCRRAFDAGLKLLYFPETRLVHHIGQSAKKNYFISVSNQIFNKIKFFRKYNSGLESVLVTALGLYQVTLKIVFLGLLSPFNAIYRKKAEAYVHTWPRVISPPRGIQ